MEEKTGRKSHALTWTLILLIGGPIFYFLTLPWGAALTDEWHLRHSAGFNLYLMPARALSDCGPWHRVFDPYCVWCWHIVWPADYPFHDPFYRAWLQITRT